ncbi:MAG: hypothetical protein ABL932_10430 [Terricaulis sp.]
MKAVNTATLLAALALGACATAPDRIAAIAPPPNQYVGMSCGQLSAERATLDQSLVRLEASQRRTRAIDTAGVALLFLPIGSLVGGNHGPEIGTLRGERRAIDAQLSQGSCGSANEPIAVNDPTS